MSIRKEENILNYLDEENYIHLELGEGFHDGIINICDFGLNGEYGIYVPQGYVPNIEPYIMIIKRDDTLSHVTDVCRVSLIRPAYIIGYGETFKLNTSEKELLMNTVSKYPIWRRIIDEWESIYMSEHEMWYNIKIPPIPNYNKLGDPDMNLDGVMKLRLDRYLRGELSEEIFISECNDLYHMCDDEYFTEKTFTKNKPINIAVNFDGEQNRGYFNDPYFKAFKGDNPNNAEIVCRIKIYEPKYVIHENEKWIMNGKEKKDLIKILTTKTEGQTLWNEMILYTISVAIEKRISNIKEVTTKLTAMLDNMPDYTKLR